MVLDRDNLRNTLFGLVGFYSPDHPDYPNILPSLLESRSSFRVNEAHPLLTVENIDQSIKNFSHFVYPDYNGTTDTAGGYTAGSKVLFTSRPYEYINAAASVGGNPPPDTTFWREIDELSDYLIKSVFSGTDRMMNDWINAKKMRAKIKSIYDQILLFSGVANYRDLVVNRDHFVGLRIRMKRGERSLVTIINKIGSQFSGTFAGLNIFIFHSSQQEAISTFTIDSTQSLSQQWTVLPTTVENKLRYISDDYDAGGDFYIGYKQSELEALGGQALRMDLNWREAPCDCDSEWMGWWKQYTPFIDVIGFEVGSLGVGDTLFDPALIGINPTNNYGLNLNLSNKCDIGYFVIQEEELFAEAMQLSIALELMRAIAYNIRGGNQVANQLRSEAKKELFHSAGVWGTLRDLYDKSIKGLSFDLSGLAEECFPCDDGSPDVVIGTRTLR